jgi:hypothetical protein
MASWDHDAGSRDTAQRSDLEIVRSTAPFLDGGLSGANRGAVSSPAGLRAADAASLPNFVKSNNAEVGLIPQRRGPAAASGLAQRSTPCAPHTKVSETRTVEASNKTRARCGMNMLVTGDNGYVGRLGIRRRFASHEAISTQKDSMVAPTQGGEVERSCA